MTEFPFLVKVRNQYQLDVTEQKNHAVLKSRKTNALIEVFRDEYSSSSGDSAFLCYTVYFSTQHRHFDCWKDAQGLVDQEELRETEAQVETYIRQILSDEVLPIEFYGVGQFGGDITRDDYFNLSAALLTERFLCSVEELSQCDFEIHSWSGQYDVQRTPVTELPLRKG